MTINCNGNIPGFVKWSVGYPNAATAGELYVTNLQITGPDGATYIEDGDFAGGQHMSEYSAYTSKVDTISIVPVDGWAVPTVSPTEMPTATLVPSISLEPSALPISAPSASPMLGPTSSPSQSPNPTPPPTPQRSANYVALSALYVATNGAGWSSKENWMTGSEPCEASWDNVACDATTNTKIYSVNLNSMNLQGTLPTGKGPLIICALPIFFPLSHHTLVAFFHLLPLQRLGFLHTCAAACNWPQMSSLEPYHQASANAPLLCLKPWRSSIISHTSYTCCFSLFVVPTEIGLLADFTATLNLQKSKLTGSLPSQLGALTGLKWTFNVWGNSFEGSIPRYTPPS